MDTTSSSSSRTHIVLANNGDIFIAKKWEKHSTDGHAATNQWINVYFTSSGSLGDTWQRTGGLAVGKQTEKTRWGRRMQELNRQSIDAISAIPLKNACELKEVIGKVTGEAFNPAVSA